MGRLWVPGDNCALLVELVEEEGALVRAELRVDFNAEREVFFEFRFPEAVDS